MSTQTDNGNIQVFGGKQTAETTTQTPSEAVVAEPKTNNASREADGNIQVFGNKPQKDTETKPSEEEQAKTESSKDNPKTESKSEVEKTTQEESPKAFAVNFEESKKEIKDDPKPTEQKQEAVSMSEESVLQFLQKQFPDAFAEVKSLKELSKKEELAEPVKAFNKFNKETGRGLKDFYNSQKDWSNEDPVNTLKEYYKLTNEGLSDEDVETQIELINPSDDDEYLSDDEKKRKGLEFRKEYARAKKFMEEKSKEWKTPLESTRQAPQQPSAEDIAKAYQPYWTERDKSLDNFNQVEFSVGIGSVKLDIDESMKKLIANRTQTQESYFKDWTKEGKIDTKEAVEDTAWGIKAIRQQLVSQIAEQVHALTMEDFSKQNRNVTLGKIPEKAKEQKTGSVQTFGGTEQTKMGTPLIRN
jgi:hypothetical protein